MILKGGNAVDAAIATAITLAIVEPTMNGIGSDAFAIIWDGKKVIGLNASGRAHLQMMIRIFNYGQNPQAAIDAPRWRVMQRLKISLEKGFNKNVFMSLSQKGHQVTQGHYFEFGGAQIIYKLDNGYLGASDWRKDGQAVGF